MMTPSPGVAILSLNTLNRWPRPRPAILRSIRRFDDCASVFCASRMHTAAVPRSAWQVSTRSSPKKCDLPEPLPPCTALYLAGAHNGSKIRAVGVFRIDNDALDSVDQFKGAVAAVLDRLGGPAPSAVENGVGSRYFGGRGRILAAHHADQDIQRCARMASGERANFGTGSGH